MRRREKESGTEKWRRVWADQPKRLSLSRPELESIPSPRLAHMEKKEGPKKKKKKTVVRAGTELASPVIVPPGARFPALSMAEPDLFWSLAPLRLPVLQWLPAGNVQSQR